MENFILLRLMQDLQVEHPISEMVSGLDLVKLQIRYCKWRTTSIQTKGSKDEWICN